MMKPRFTKRRCPKCGGNLYPDSAYYIKGNYITWYEEETCLQCGFIYGIKIPPKPVVTATINGVIPTVKQLVTV